MFPAARHSRNRNTSQRYDRSRSPATFCVSLFAKALVTGLLRCITMPPGPQVANESYEQTQVGTTCPSCLAELSPHENTCITTAQLSVIAPVPAKPNILSPHGRLESTRPDRATAIVKLAPHATREVLLPIIPA